MSPCHGAAMRSRTVCMWPCKVTTGSWMQLHRKMANMLLYTIHQFCGLVSYIAFEFQFMLISFMVAERSQRIVYF